MTAPGDLTDRVRRLEAHEAIRQLAARHALALDQRDLDGLAALYVPDVAVPDGTTGRPALAAWFDRALRPFGVTFHLVGGHVIDLDDRDPQRASGTVTSRAEYEAGGRWLVVAAVEEDTYRCHEGTWLLARRRTHAFYGAGLGEHPLEVAGRWSFDDAPPGAVRDLPERWPTWRAWWGPSAADRPGSAP